MKEQVLYWEKWGGAEKRAMLQVVSAFNASQPRYEVVMVDAGDWSSSPDLAMFLRAEAEGTPPDIIGLEDHQIPDLAASGATRVLPSRAMDPRNLSHFRPEFLSLGEYNSTTYAIPISVDLVTYYVNLDAVKGTTFESGVLPPRQEDFLEAIRRETDGPMFLVPSYPGWWPHLWAVFFGGSWIGTDGSFTPFAPGNKEAMEWVHEVREDLILRGRGILGYERLADILASDICPFGKLDPDPFLSGDVAIVLEGDWIARRFASHPGLRWKPSAIPFSHNTPSAMIVADVLAIPSSAENPEGAAAFIQFATSREQIERLAAAQAKISPMRQWPDPFLETHPNPCIKDLLGILDSSELFHEPRIPGWLGHAARIKVAFGDVWSGRRGPTEALESLR